MVNLYETPIMPSVDLDSEVIVYVPGYAIKGPEVPTLVNSTNFESLFGDAPYVFAASEASKVHNKNSVLKGAKEKSWLFAKGLVDAGLTVLFDRYTLKNAVRPCTEAFSITENSGGEQATGLTFYARSKYPGVYYKGMIVKLEKKSNGVTTVSVSRNGSTLESVNVSFDTTAENFIGNIEFSNIEFYSKTEDASGQEVEISMEDLVSGYTASVEKPVYYAAGTQSLTTTATDDGFTVKEFEEALEDDIFDILKDTDNYPVTYITSGGYFQNSTIAGKMMSIGNDVKAVALVDIPSDIADEAAFTTFQANLSIIPTNDTLDKSFGAQFVGCDTFSVNGQRVVLPDSFGYLVKLGGNIQAGIPAWIPVANNDQGNVSIGVAATRPISRQLSLSMIGDVGCSVNPIVRKQNIGYVIMGNRTLYPNSGVLGPQSFLNCRLVVNSVERSARKAASALTIVSTNPDTAFKKFKNSVTKTLDKMLVNGDGLNAYDIIKLPKTKPATIDIEISLVVVEGIETFNIYIPYSIALD